VASKRLEAERTDYKKYKDDVRKEGKSFFPYAIYHDAVMSLVVVCVIVGLACVWYFTADDNAEGPGREPGSLGALYEAKADPGTTNFIPRPDWFFYFLFYLLRIFKWPNTVVLGTVGVPTIALILLIGLPFYDRGRERRPMRRPTAMIAGALVVLSMAVLTWKGATAEEALGSELIADQVPQQWAETQGFTGNKAAEAGATLFAQTGCLQCHTYLGVGAGNLGAPDLSDVGADKEAPFFIEYLKNPAAQGNKVMGSYAYLGEENLAKLGAFLSASTGGSGK
jgi:quinol---cytochrome c reductase cytochrome c subunit, bacillus type